MTFLYDYIKNIAVFIIFSAFAEIIVVNGKYSQYIKIIIGFFMMIFILQPIINIFNNGGIDVFNSVQNEFDKVIAEKEGDFYDERQKEIIKERFSFNLKKQIEKCTENICDISDIQVYFTEDSFDIARIDIYAIPKEEEKSFFRIEKYLSEQEKQEKFAQNLKNIISDFYNLPIDNINIIVRKN